MDILNRGVRHKNQAACVDCVILVPSLRFEKKAITPNFQQFPLEPSSRGKTASKLNGSRDPLWLTRSFVR